jgi:hypothetical protein
MSFLSSYLVFPSKFFNKTLLTSGWLGSDLLEYILLESGDEVFDWHYT